MYFTESFDLTNPSGAENKLASFGLINLDEFDRLPASRMPQLKNLMQMECLNIRSAAGHRLFYAGGLRSAVCTVEAGTGAGRTLLVQQGRGTADGTGEPVVLSHNACRGTAGGYVSLC